MAAHKIGMNCNNCNNCNNPVIAALLQKLHSPLGDAGLCSNFFAGGELHDGRFCVGGALEKTMGPSSVHFAGNKLPKFRIFSVESKKIPVTRSFQPDYTFTR